VLHLINGARLDGDDERAYTEVGNGQAGGDGLYAADVAEATGLSEERARQVLQGLVDREVLATTHLDPELGPRYVLTAAG